MCLEIGLYPILLLKKNTVKKREQNTMKKLSSAAGGLVLSLISTIHMLASTLSLLNSVFILTRFPL